MAYRNLENNLGKESLAMLKEVKEFTSKTLRPSGTELDLQNDPEKVTDKDSILWDVFKTHRKLDLHLLNIPGSLGGLMEDIDAMTSLLITELMGYGDSGLAMGLEISGIPFMFAAGSGDPGLNQLAQAYCNDKDCRMIGCCAVKGQDQYDAETDACLNAIEKGDTYIVNGNVTKVPNSTIASHGLFSLDIKSTGNGNNAGLAILPLDLPGTTKGKALDRMGLRSLNQGSIVFQNVEIPKACLISCDSAETNKLLNVFHAGINDLKGIIFAGLAMAAYDEAFAYSRERIQGCVPICEHRNIKLQLFKMFKMVESARANARRTFSYNREQTDDPSIAHAVASKCLSTETAVKVVDEAIQIFGGNGLAREYPLDKMFRDARAGTVEGGTNDFQGVSAANYL